MNSMSENCECEQFSGLTLPLWGRPVNNPITLRRLYHQYSGGCIFCRWQSMRSSANFWTVFSESQNAYPLDVELEPDFNAKRPFKVIQGHLFRCQWRATKGLYIVHYNNCGLEWRFVRYSERIEMTIFDSLKNRKSSFSNTPLSFDATSPGNPCEYLHKPYTDGNYVPWATF